MAGTEEKVSRMNEDELKNKLKILELDDDDATKRVACSLIGHSKIQTSFFGYFYCARCGDQVGDALGSIYDTTGVVIVGHACDVCRENYEKCTWQDTFMCPDPFEEETKDV